MVQDEQGGGVMVAQQPSWPPQESSIRKESDFMAKCAKTGGREIEWPPRDELYGSNPALNSSSGDQAHSSAPNLLEGRGPKIARPLPPKPVTTVAPASSGERGAPDAMASQHSTTSSSSQVRVMSSQSYQSHQPVMGQEYIVQPNQQQFTMSGSPSMQRRNIPINHDASQQQHVLQQQMPQQQQQQFQHQNQQFQHPLPQQQPMHREFNVPIQMASNTPTPPPSVNNPMTQSFGQGAMPQGAMPHGPVQGVPYGSPAPAGIQQPSKIYPQSGFQQQPQNMQPQTGFQQFPNAPNQPGFQQPSSVPPQSGFQQLSNAPPFSGVPPQGFAQAGAQNPMAGPATGSSYDPTQFQGPVPCSTTEWPPQPQQEQGPDGNLTTVYPSNFKLRSEMPVQQERARVITSQPAFKSTKPMKMRGDCKWPPAGSGEDTSEQEVREFIKPRKQEKDYSGFFAKHALPSSYTGYRAPPGTQHVGVDEQEDASDM